MILKLKIKPNKQTKKKEITVWIQKNEDFNGDIQQIFQFFKDSIEVSQVTRFSKYFKVTSVNPAIMMSLFSAANDLIPEIYFNEEEPLEMEEPLNY